MRNDLSETLISPRYSGIYSKIRNGVLAGTMLLGGMLPGCNGEDPAADIDKPEAGQAATAEKEEAPALEKKVTEAPAAAPVAPAPTAPEKKAPKTAAAVEQKPALEEKVAEAVKPEVYTIPPTIVGVFTNDPAGIHKRRATPAEKPAPVVEAAPKYDRPSLFTLRTPEVPAVSKDYSRTKTTGKEGSVDDVESTIGTREPSGRLSGAFMGSVGVKEDKVKAQAFFKANYNPVTKGVPGFGISIKHAQIKEDRLTLDDLTSRETKLRAGVFDRFRLGRVGYADVGAKVSYTHVDFDGQNAPSNIDFPSAGAYFKLTFPKFAGSDVTVKTIVDYSHSWNGDYEFNGRTQDFEQQGLLVGFKAINKARGWHNAYAGFDYRQVNRDYENMVDSKQKQFAFYAGLENIGPRDAWYHLDELAVAYVRNESVSNGIDRDAPDAIELKAWKRLTDSLAVRLDLGVDFDGKPKGGLTLRHEW